MGNLEELENPVLSMAEERTDRPAFGSPPTLHPLRGPRIREEMAPSFQGPNAASCHMGVAWTSVPALAGQASCGPFRFSKPVRLSGSRNKASWLPEASRNEIELMRQCQVAEMSPGKAIRVKNSCYQAGFQLYEDNRIAVIYSVLS